MSYDPRDDLPEDNSALIAALEPFEECEHEYHSGICDFCDEPDPDYEPDGAPMTQEEVTAGYVNPSYERMNAWNSKLELTR